MRGAGFKERVDVFCEQFGFSTVQLAFSSFSLPCFLFFFFLFPLRLAGRLAASFQPALAQEGGWSTAGYGHKNLYSRGLNLSHCRANDGGWGRRTSRPIHRNSIITGLAHSSGNEGQGHWTFGGTTNGKGERRVHCASDQAELARQMQANCEH